MESGKNGLRSLHHRPKRLDLRVGSLLLAALCAAIFLWTVALPIGRVFLLAEIDYNEGWNVYNAQKVAEHQQLYPVTYAWTAVNYPALSFHLVAALSKFTHEYLFTGRILSLIGLLLCAVFAGLIVRHTTRSKNAAWLTGFFLVALFCATANNYVGMDDPQMLAQGFFMAGLFFYLRGNRRSWALELTALFFVVGGNIKHNLIEFPLAALLDLLICAPRRALRFALSGALMVAFSVLLTSRIDGAAYVSCMLTSRSYSALTGIANLSHVLLLVLLPTLAALWTAWFCWKHSERRVLALLLLCALAVNAFFCGGSGVDINGTFGSLLAIVLLCGVFFAEFPRLPWAPARASSPLLIASIFFLWLAIPMISSGIGRTDWSLRGSRNSARRFAEDVAFLRRQPGPAICESILRCAYAGKPYLYDPFNATRFIEKERLDPGVIVARLRDHEYGAIQLYDTVDQEYINGGAQTSFAPPILQAIDRYYRLASENEDGVIYLPKENGE